MDDLQYGKRNKRGDWSPNEALQTGPLMTLPFRPLIILKWLPGYFFPWTTIIFLTSLFFWAYLTPDRETLKTLSVSWIALLFLRNAVWVLLWYGAFELVLYIKRRQGLSFKYNGKWPADNKSDVFMFKSQNIDNIIRSFGSGVPIWTAYEVLMLWAWANGWGPWLVWPDGMAWLIVLAIILQMIHELHFYCVHRLIHVPMLYRRVHSVHHNSVNPSPWSSLSMHPVEHVLYWSGVLIHLVIPSHPLLAIYHINLAGTGAIVGHIGFEKMVVSGDTAIDSNAYAHYLHHKHFEVNYADGGIPLDRWFGTWHDGTAEGDRLMNARYEAKRDRMNAKS